MCCLPLTARRVADAYKPPFSKSDEVFDPRLGTRSRAVSCTAQAFSFACGPGSRSLRLFAEHGFDAANIVVDFSGEDWTKLSSGNFSMQY